MVQFLGAGTVDIVSGGEHFAADTGSLTQAVNLGLRGVTLFTGGVALAFQDVETDPDNQGRKVFVPGLYNRRRAEAAMCAKGL